MVFLYNVLASHQGLSLSPCPWMVEKDRQALSHSFLLFSAIVGYGIVVFCYLSSEPWHFLFGCGGATNFGPEPYSCHSIPILASISPESSPYPQRQKGTQGMQILCSKHEEVSPEIIMKLWERLQETSVWLQRLGSKRTQFQKQNLTTPNKMGARFQDGAQPSVHAQ